MLHASAGCLPAAIVSLAYCATAAQASPRCLVQGHTVRGVRTSKILKLTGAVVVYRTGPTETEYAPEVADVWACGRKSNRFVLVGREELDQEYGTEGVLSAIQIAGSWLLARRETGAVALAECYKYTLENAPNCPSTSESLVLANVARGAQGAISDVNSRPGASPAPVSSSLLSAAGAVAWLQAFEKQPTASLYGCAAAVRRHAVECAPRQIAQGAIPAASLRLVGTTLSWSAAGQPQSSVL